MDWILIQCLSGHLPKLVLQQCQMAYRTYKVRQAYGKMYVVISLFNIYVYLHDASYW